MSSTIFLAILTLGQPGWSAPEQCGPNSLYAFARLTGTEIPYQAVVDNLHVTRKAGGAVSLDDLQTAATRLGIRSEIRKVKPADFNNLPTPAIVHLELADAGGGGHFVTLYYCGESMVFYVDGATGTAVTQSLGNFTPLTTGYVLIPTARSPFTTSWWSAFLLGAMLAVPFLMVIVFSRRGRALPSRPTRHAVSANQFTRGREPSSVHRAP